MLLSTAGIPGLHQDRQTDNCWEAGRGDRYKNGHSILKLIKITLYLIEDQLLILIETCIKVFICTLIQMSIHTSADNLGFPPAQQGSRGLPTSSSSDYTGIPMSHEKLPLDMAWLLLCCLGSEQKDLLPLVLSWG